MVVQDEVGWLLEIIKSNWPEASFPSNLARVNRDEPRVLETDERTMAVSLDRWNVVGVSSGSIQRELFGTSPQYRVQTTLDVRVEAKANEEWGEASSVADFDTLVAYIQAAITDETTYPDVDPSAESIGRVHYLDARIQDETRQSANYKDSYRTDFTVELRGNAEL